VWIKLCVYFHFLKSFNIVEVNNIVPCIPVAKPRLRKQASTIDRLLPTGSAPRPLLCNISVKTFQQCRLCFLLGLCRGVILTIGATRQMHPFGDLVEYIYGDPASSHQVDEAYVRATRNAYKILVRKREWKRPLERHTYILFPLALQPNLGLGRLHKTFRFISVTRSRTVGRTIWLGDPLVARPLRVCHG
jgi:hypothetical protein